jgi:hypothetical protein
VVSLASLASNVEKSSNLGLTMELASGRSDIFVGADGIKANIFLHCTASKILANVIFDRFLMVNSVEERGYLRTKCSDEGECEHRFVKSKVVRIVPVSTLRKYPEEGLSHFLPSIRRNGSRTS